MKKPSERLMNKVLKLGDCWLFTGVVKRDGYGTFYFRKKLWQAHRASYEIFVGGIPKGLTVHHKCNVRNCVNPDHLKPLSIRDNTLLGDTIPSRHLKKTHCPFGHPYSKENTYIRISRTSRSRQCRACGSSRTLAHYHRKQAEKES